MRCVGCVRCVGCARGAKWIAHNDRIEDFKMGPLQSELGQALMIHYATDPTDPTSRLYLEEGRAYASPDAPEEHPVLGCRRAGFTGSAT